MTQPTFITKVLETEDGELFLEFPEELLDAMGWGEGTVLDLEIIAGNLIIRASSEDSSEQTGAIN
jgi:hypothetical protein